MIRLSLGRLGLIGRAELERMARDAGGTGPIEFRVPSHPFREALVGAALAHARVFADAARRDVLVFVGADRSAAAGVAVSP